MFKIFITVPGELVIRWGKSINIPTCDYGYLSHAFMRKAFCETSPQPFTVKRIDNTLSIIGMSHVDVCEIQDSFCPEGDSLLNEIVASIRMKSMRLPDYYAENTQIRFSAQCCPVRRSSKTGKSVEKDAYLCELEHSEREKRKPMTRHECYLEWLSKRMVNTGATLVEYDIRDFLLSTPSRRGGKDHSGSPFIIGDRPRVEFYGVLSVEDPVKFSASLMAGIGRHKAFGYGMIDLQFD